MEKISRREFIRLAGGFMGAAAAGSLLPGFAFGEEGGQEAVFALSALRQPGFIAPAIVTPDMQISFEKSLQGAGIGIDSIWLQPTGKSEQFSLAVESSGAEAGGLLRAESQLAPGMYDLFMKISREGKRRLERQPNAVKVIDSFKKDFVFGAISDIHFGDTRLTAELPGFDHAAVVKKEIAALNNNNVEFCICCGDTCFIPPNTKKELLEFAGVFAENAKFPMFSVPGNHDGYSTGSAGRINFDTFDYWKKYFGTLYYSASYNDIALIGLNTYDKPAAERNLYGGKVNTVDMGGMAAEQLAWLENALKAARTGGASTIIVFGHHNPTNTVTDVNGPFKVVPFSEYGRKELLALFEKYKPEYYFCGHVHGVYEETYADTKIITLPTAGSKPFGDFPIGISLVKVSGGNIASIETVKIAGV
jgi:hypothetical protein